MNKYAVRWVVGTIVAFLMVVLFSSSWPPGNGAEVAASLTTLKQRYHERQGREKNLYCYTLAVYADTATAQVYTVTSSTTNFERHWVKEEWQHEQNGWHLTQQIPLSESPPLKEYAGKKMTGYHYKVDGFMVLPSSVAPLYDNRDFAYAHSHTDDCIRGIWRYISDEDIQDFNLPCRRHCDD